MENGDNLGIYLLDVSCSRAGCIVQAVLYCIAPGIDVIDGKLALSVVEGLFDLLGFWRLGLLRFCRVAVRGFGGIELDLWCLLCWLRWVSGCVFETRTWNAYLLLTISLDL